MSTISRTKRTLSRYSTTDRHLISNFRFESIQSRNEETESTTVLMPLLKEAEDVDRSADVQDHIINIYSKNS
ncbi:hypothetical protein E1301_Tti021152 [Triplophysa tibetana]|uniref:Uncharacterized protein n=1 Tax=Triplophysa tibetana TaxID=1572043 RepID=A0A5A9NU56_9TELE|nr:hypothetical protein E1301_Tti021152 [Triplophysa tibetana]